MTIQAAVTGAAIIDGANVLSGWSPQSNGIYTHTWTPNLGTCAVPSGWPGNIPTIARRTEMLFVNGVPMTQVMAHSQLRHGTFFVSEGANLIYLDPPTGVNVHTANIEAAERRVTLNISGRKNIVLRGMVFRHAATCINTAGVNVNGSSNILFDSDQAVWNNWGGIGIYHTNNVTVQNSVANHNGGVGFTATNDQYVLFNFNESDYNNWRGAQGALYDWGMGGAKLMRMRNTTVQNHFSYHNQAQGLWFDTDNKNITINNATLSGNHMAALQLEANEGPITRAEQPRVLQRPGCKHSHRREADDQKQHLSTTTAAQAVRSGGNLCGGLANGHKITRLADRPVLQPVHQGHGAQGKHL